MRIRWGQKRYEPANQPRHGQGNSTSRIWEFIPMGIQSWFSMQYTIASRQKSDTCVICFTFDCTSESINAHHYVWVIGDIWQSMGGWRLTTAGHLCLRYSTDLSCTVQKCVGWYPCSAFFLICLLEAWITVCIALRCWAVRHVSKTIMEHYTQRWPVLSVRMKGV